MAMIDRLKEMLDNIEEYAAATQENTERSAAKAFEIQELDQEIADFTKHIEQLTSMREAKITKYEVLATNLGKGVFSLEGAVCDAKTEKLTMAYGPAPTYAAAPTYAVAPTHAA